MRKKLYMVLMLLMLTPSMVCVMAVCPEPAQAADVSSEAPALPPCHQSAAVQDESLQDGNLLAMPMLVQDCLMNDLTTASNIDVPANTGLFVVLGFVLPVMALGLPLFRQAAFSGATGPPERPRGSLSHLLYTKRLRP